MYGFSSFNQILLNLFNVIYIYMRGIARRMQESWM